MIEEMWGGPTGGRHALDEEAVQTPIFHALTRGGWRRRQQERADASLEEFRRDPLTAPIPIQVLVPAPARQAPPAREWPGSAVGVREWSAREWPGLTALAERGRHHRTAVGSRW